MKDVQHLHSVHDIMPGHNCVTRDMLHNADDEENQVYYNRTARYACREIVMCNCVMTQPDQLKGLSNLVD